MSHYNLCLDGGLGDCFFRLFQYPRYPALDELRPEDTCDIHIYSHCPSVKELFDYHPKKSQLNIIVHHWKPVKKHEHIKEHNNIPEEIYPPYLNAPSLIYPSEEDKQIVDALGTDPFVLISAVAGGPVRNVPLDILRECYSVFKNAGFKVVVTGRSYNRAGISTNNVEKQYCFGDGTIDLVDKLTLPGSLYLISRSAGLVAAHSSMCLFNWFVTKKPNLIFYPNEYARNRFDIEYKNPKDVKVFVEDMYCFGKDYENTHITFRDSFSFGVLEKFICALR